MDIWWEWVSGRGGGNGHDLFKEEQGNQRGEQSEPGAAAWLYKVVAYGEGSGFCLE